MTNSLQGYSLETAFGKMPGPEGREVPILELGLERQGSWEDLAGTKELADVFSYPSHPS